MKARWDYVRVSARPRRSEMDLSLLMAFLVYLVVLIVVGIITYRMMHTHDDYYLAGRRLNPWVTALSAEASSESGWLLLGLPGQAFSQGIGAFWVAFGCLAGTFFNWTTVAKRLRKITGFFKAITIPDYLESRFDDKSHTLRVVAALLIGVFMTSYVAAQLVASGKALSVTFGLDYAPAVVLGSAVILFYTMMGGFFAVAWTDVVQAVMMFVGLVVIPVVGTIKLGGPSAVVARLSECAADTPGFLSMLGIGLGYPGQPHVLVRFMAIRKPSLLRKGAFIGVIWAAVALYGAVLVGLLARGILTADVVDPERVMPLLAIELLPSWIAGIMIAAAMAAIMSTADSQLLVASSSFVQDFYRKTFGRNPKPSTLVLMSRLVTLGLGVLGMAIALRQDPENPVGVVFWLVLYAWGGLASAFGPVIVLSLYTRRVTRAGALAGMLSGAVTVIVWQNIAVLNDFLYVLIPGVVVSTAAVLIVSRFTRPPAEGSAAVGVDAA
jgi:sodium/proline symporter